MDTRAYVDKASGKTLALINGTVYEVTISTVVEIGKRYITKPHPNGPEYLLVRHTDDLVWHLVWANFLVSETVKAHRFLRNLAIETRIDLFGSSTLGNATPLPFDKYRYSFA